MPTTDAASPVLAEGLETIRRAAQARLSRRLHDEIGPALCAAGLMAGLVRSSAPGLSAEALAGLDKLEQALEAAVSAVRLLSYTAAPDLVQRAGLAGALEQVARAWGASFHPAGPPAAAGARQAEGICRIVQDVLLAAPPEARPASVELNPRGAAVSVNWAVPATVRAALGHAASGAGLILRIKPAAALTLITILVPEEP